MEIKVLKKILFLLIIHLLLYQHQVQGVIQGQILNDPKIVNFKTKLVIDINYWDSNKQLPAGSYFNVIFPAGDFQNYFSQFSQQETNLPQAECANSYGFNTKDNLDCKVFKLSRTVRVKTTMQTSRTFVGFVIGNVVNMDSARRSGFFKINLYDQNGSLIDSSNTQSKLQIKTEPDTIQKVSVINSNTTVGEYGILTFRITPNNRVGASGNILFIIPKWNALSQDSDKKLSYLKNNECSIIQQSESNIKSDAKCSAVIGNNQDTVTIQSALDSKLQQGEEIIFSIGQVRNPPSLKGINIQLVQIQNFDGNAIEEISNVEYKPLKMALVPPQYYTPTFAQDMVSVFTDFFFRIQFINPVPANSVIRITFPPEVMITDSSGQQSYLNSVKTGISFLDYKILKSSGTTLDTVLITNAFSSYEDSGSSLNLQFSKVKTPISSAKTRSFKISVEQYDGKKYYPIEGIQEGLTIQTAAQQLPSIDFQTSSQNVFQAINATISTRFKGYLKPDDVIEMEVPRSLTLNNKFDINTSKAITVQCSTIIGGITYMPSCRFNPSTRIIEFQSISPIKLDFTQFNNGQLMQLVMIDLTVNPSDSQPIKIETSIKIKDGQQNLIAEYDSKKSTQKIQYKAVPVNIKQIQIQALNEFTGAQGQYEIKIQILEGQKFDSGLQMEINLPQQIGLIPLFKIKCTKGNNIDNDPLCSEVSSQQDQSTIKVEFINQINGFVGNKQYSFIIDSFRNPWTTQTSETFKIKLKNKDNFMIAQQLSDVTLAVQKPNQFNKIDIQRGSLVNGIYTSYTFNITMSNLMESESKLTITLPQSIRVKTLDGTFIECGGKDLLKTSLECKLTSRKIDISLSLQSLSSIKSGQFVLFTLFNVMNPLTEGKTQSFQFDLRTKDRLYMISRDVSGFEIQNTEVPLITDGEIIALNPNLNQASKYSIDLMPIIPIVQNALVNIQMPQKLKRDSNSQVKCSEEKIIKSNLQCTYDVSSHQVNILTQLQRDQISPARVSFQISGFLNPNEPSFSESFQVRIYDDKQNLNQQILEGLSFTKTCDFPCLTCGLSKKTCLSCQLDSIYTLLYNNTCINKCPSGFFGNSNFKCEKCSQECKTCENTATNCTSCSNPKDFFDPNSGKCLNACPSGQYTDLKTYRCKDCNKNCTTCTGIDTCTSCVNGFFLEKNSCFDTCPKMMIPSPDRKSCISCKSPCKECFETIDHCSSCDQSSKYKFLYGFTCLEKCPSNYYPSVKDGFTCELIQEDVVPFVFLLASVIASLGIGIAKIFKKNKIHYKNTQIGVISSICLTNWIFLVYLTVKDHMWQSTVVLLYGLCSSYILNGIFFCLYLKVMRHDEYYNKWRENRKKRETCLVIFALLTSFQLYRIVFQQLSRVIKLHKEEKEKKKKEKKLQQQNKTNTDIEVEGGDDINQINKSPNKVNPVQEKEKDEVSEPLEMLYKFSDENSVKSIFNKLTVIMISAVLVPVLIQNIYNLFFTTPGRQLFWEDIESICITSYLLVLMIWDAYKKTKKIDLAQLKRGGRRGSSFHLPERPESSRNSRFSFRGSIDSKSLSSLFNNTQELKRFKDILTHAIRKNETGNRSKITEDYDKQEGEVTSPDKLPFEKLDENYQKIQQISAFNMQHKELNKYNQSHQNKSTINKLDTTGLTVNTDDQMIITSDRHLMAGDMSGRSIDRGQQSQIQQADQIKKKKFQKNYRSPILEESNIQMTSEDENIRSSYNDAVSEGEISHDQNRQNIHGQVDPDIVTKLNFEKKETGRENFRGSEIVLANKFDIKGLSDTKMTGFIAGRGRDEELQYTGEIINLIASQASPNNFPNNQSNFSLGSLKGDRPSESMDQREGGQETLITNEKHFMQILNSNNFTNNTLVSSPNFVKQRRSREESENNSSIKINTAQGSLISKINSQHKEAISASKLTDIESSIQKIDIGNEQHESRNQALKNKSVNIKSLVGSVKKDSIDNIKNDGDLGDIHNLVDKNSDEKSQNQSKPEKQNNQLSETDMNNLIKILKEKEGGNQLINALVEHKNSMNQQELITALKLLNQNNPQKDESQENQTQISVLDQHRNTLKDIEVQHLMKELQRMQSPQEVSVLDQHRKTLKDIEIFGLIQQQIMANMSSKRKTEPNQESNNLMLQRQSTIDEIEKLYQNLKSPDSQENLNRQVSSSISDYLNQIGRISVLDKDKFVNGQIMDSPGFRIQLQSSEESYQNQTKILTGEGNPLDVSKLSKQQNKRDDQPMETPQRKQKDQKSRQDLILNTHQCAEQSSSSSNEARASKLKSTKTEAQITKVLNQVHSHHSSAFEEHVYEEKNIKKSKTNEDMVIRDTLDPAHFEMKLVQDSIFKNKDKKDNEENKKEHDHDLHDPYKHHDCSKEKHEGYKPTFNDLNIEDHHGDDIKLLNPNLQNFGQQSKDPRNRKALMMMETQKKSDSYVHRTNTSMTDEKDEKKKLEEDKNSKERPVTAFQKDGKYRPGKAMIENQSPINDAAWLEKLQDESIRDKMTLTGQNFHKIDSNDNIIASSKHIMSRQKTVYYNEKDIGFYQQQTDEKSRISGSVMGASAYAKSYSPVKRFQKQQETIQNLQKQKEMAYRLSRTSAKIDDEENVLNQNKKSTISQNSGLKLKRGSTILNNVQTGQLGLGQKKLSSQISHQTLTQKRKSTISPMTRQESELRKQKSQLTSNMHSIRPEERNQIKREMEKGSGTKSSRVNNWNSIVERLSKRSDCEHVGHHNHSNCQRQEIKPKGPEKFLDPKREEMAESHRQRVNDGSSSKNHHSNHRKMLQNNVRSTKPDNTKLNVPQINTIEPSRPSIGKSTTPLGYTQKTGDFLDQQISNYEMQSRQGIRYNHENLSQAHSNIGGHSRRALSQFGRSSIDQGSRPTSSKYKAQQNQQSSNAKDKDYYRKSANFRAGAAIIGNTIEFDMHSNLGSQRSRILDGSQNANMNSSRTPINHSHSLSQIKK